MNKKVFFKTFGITTVILLAVIGALFYWMLHASIGHVEDIEELDKVLPDENQNIVVFGTDKEGLRSDVVMIFSVDPEENCVNIMSIPRDTKIYIGNEAQKFNAALAIGKESLAVQKVKELTGMAIHDYVTLNFDAVETIIDALGGVDYNVPQNMNYEDPVQDLYIHLKAGEQHLDGEHALQLLRFRKYAMADIKRTEVQRDFIKACFEQKFNARYIAKIPEIYGAVDKNVKTSLTLAEAMSYVTIVKSMQNGGVHSYEFPYDISGDFVVPRQAELKDIVEKHFK